MTRADALRALLMQTEAGEYLDMFPAFPVLEHRNLFVAAWNGSLDAAKALHEAVLPGFDFQMDSSTRAVFVSKIVRPAPPEDHTPGLIDGPRYPEVKSFYARSDILSRAWLIAILKALIATEDN